MSRRPAVVATAAPARARHFHHDPELRRRAELAVPRPNAVPRPLVPRHPAAPQRLRHAHKPDVAAAPKAAARPRGLRTAIEENLLLISSVLLFAGSVGWCVLLYGQFRQSGLFAPAPAALYAATGQDDVGIGKADPMGLSTFVRGAPGEPATLADRINLADAFDQTGSLGAARSEPAANVVAREWSYFLPNGPAGPAGSPAPAAKAARLKAAPAAPPVHVASLTPTLPLAAPNPPPDLAASRMPANVEAKTELADFKTAPFPYHGLVPGTEHPFLNAGADGNRGHVSFRGRMLLESRTFGDDHVLLHIPAGFDAKRPAVMVVFFHGHGATLARDVRDRQRLPEQMDAANAVLVAPQFAYDAADSSAGKFWEPDGFKRFLDEAAQRLAALYGDPRSQAAFAAMPIVLVSYSGGFGPTLSVLARGGANARIRGLVMLDSIYAGVDQFADWIADHRSTFFVSAYTAGTAHHNAELKHLLDQRGVAYGSVLRRDHLQGMVTFMDDEVPHRDYLTHAWTDNPVEDILARMDDVNQNVAAAGVTARRN